MYECFNCLEKAVVWQSDYDYEDFGYEGEGIVHILTCSNCGAEIEYRVPVTKEDEILNEITTFCNECASKESCSEEECVLYRIEQIVLERGKE